MRSANKLITGRSSVIKKFQTLGVASQDYPLMYSWLNKICCNIPYFSSLQLQLQAAIMRMCSVQSFNPTPTGDTTDREVKCSQHCLKTTPAMHACATEHLCSHSALIPELCINIADLNFDITDKLSLKRRQTILETRKSDSLSNVSRGSGPQVKFSYHSLFLFVLQ